MKKYWFISIIILLSGCNSNVRHSNSRCDIKPVHGYMDMKRFKKQCLAMRECRYIPEEATYCPHDLACTFGGGQAPKCKAK